MTKLAFKIHPVGIERAEEILQVYRQCEDFLALGPQAQATMEMVHADLLSSQENGGVFCGITGSDADGQDVWLGVVDYVPGGCQDDPELADLRLLMIALPYRSQGLGEEVVRAVEAEIRRDERVRTILSGVQVNNPGAIRFWERMGYRITGGPERMPDQTTVFHLAKTLYSD